MAKKETIIEEAKKTVKKAAVKVAKKAVEVAEVAVDKAAKKVKEAQAPIITPEMAKIPAGPLSSNGRTIRTIRSW